MENDGKWPIKKVQCGSNDNLYDPRLEVMTLGLIKCSYYNNLNEDYYNIRKGAQIIRRFLLSIWLPTAVT